MLIREEPATELTIATRILARSAALAAVGRLVMVTGEVVYAAGAEITNHTMTPYDVTIVRLRDGEELHGTPPRDIERYLDALRQHPEAQAAALAADGTLVVAHSVPALVATLLRRPWNEAEAEAKAAGALIGAYPVS